MSKSLSGDGPIMLIDAKNAFIRAYVSSPAVSAHGYQLGGFVGFVKTLEKLTRELVPSAIVVAWEGGGSKRRRALMPEYKLGRRPAKLNRFYGDDIPETEQNQTHQQVVLVRFLQNLPLWQVYVEDAEGDDVIAHLSDGLLRAEKQVIVSSDKDMHQLLRPGVEQYSLYRKRCLTAADVLDEYGILAENFGIAKAIVGDPTDNVAGVERVGFKTLSKAVPLLRLSSVSLADVFDYCASHPGPIAKRILASRSTVELNWDVVRLSASSLGAASSMRIHSALGVARVAPSIVGMAKILHAESTQALDVQLLHTTFARFAGCRIL